MKCLEFQCFENTCVMKYPQITDNVTLYNGTIHSLLYNGSTFTKCGNINLNTNVMHSNVGKIVVTASLHLRHAIYKDAFYTYVIRNNKTISMPQISSKQIQKQLNTEQLLQLKINLKYYDEENNIGYMVKREISHYNDDRFYTINNENIKYTCNVVNNKTFFIENNIKKIKSLRVVFDWRLVINKSLFFIMFVDDKCCIIDVNTEYDIKMLCAICPQLLPYVYKDTLYISKIKSFYIRCPDILGLPLKCKVEIKN